MPGRTTPAEQLLGTVTTVGLRPSCEGSNIGSWIGFKHINYLAEEAVLGHFRAVGLPARFLYENLGLCLETVGLDTRIHEAFHLDDLVTATIAPRPAQDDRELTFTVRLALQRGDERKKGARSIVRVLLRRDSLAGLAQEEVALPGVVDRIARPGPGSSPVPHVAGEPALGTGAVAGDAVLAELTCGANAFAWRWRIPYPYCHYTKNLQMSGYLRLMEGTVGLFLADRGISVKRLLEERNWIPVVPHSSMSVLDEAFMEEELYTVFTVEDVFKSYTFLARMDTYVLRDGRLLRTSSGRITHGYAEIKSRGTFCLVELDGRTLTALGG